MPESTPLDDSQTSMGGEDQEDNLARVHSMAREMDQADRRAKLAARSGQKGGAPLAPVTSLGQRGLALGKPRPNHMTSDSAETTSSGVSLGATSVGSRASRGLRGGGGARRPVRTPPKSPDSSAPYPRSGTDPAVPSTGLQQSPNDGGYASNRPAPRRSISEAAESTSGVSLGTTSVGSRGYTNQQGLPGRINSRGQPRRGLAGKRGVHAPFKENSGTNAPSSSNAANAQMPAYSGQEQYSEANTRRNQNNDSMMPDYSSQEQSSFPGALSSSSEANTHRNQYHSGMMPAYSGQEQSSFPGAPSSSSASTHRNHNQNARMPTTHSGTLAEQRSYHSTTVTNKNDERLDLPNRFTSIPAPVGSLRKEEEDDAEARALVACAMGMPPGIIGSGRSDDSRDMSIFVTSMNTVSDMGGSGRSEGSSAMRYAAKKEAKTSPSSQMTRLASANNEFRSNKGLSNRPPAGSAVTRLDPAPKSSHNSSSYHNTKASNNNAMDNSASSFATRESIPEDEAAIGASYRSRDTAASNRSRDTAATRADRNEQRRLKFGLSNPTTTNEPPPTVTPVLPLHGTQPTTTSLHHDSGPSQNNHNGALEDYEEQAAAGHWNPTPETMEDESLTAQEDSSFMVHPNTNNNPVVASAPIWSGPGAYRVERQQQQQESSSGAAENGQSHATPALERPAAEEFEASSNNKWKSSRGKRLWLGATCVVVLVVIVVVVAVSQTSGGGGGDVAPAQEGEESESPRSPTMAPSAPSRPPGTDIDDYLWSLLPEVTTEAIVRDINSSQALAIDWMLQDPSVEEYSNTKLLQRFALATLLPRNWLSYERDECDWRPEITCDEAGIDHDADGPNGVTKHANIRELALDENKVQGDIPPEISLLTHLTVLDLSENGLRGSIPSQLGLVTSLIELSLNNNQLAGPLPSEIGQLTILARLYLNQNQLTGSLPSEFGALVQLKDMYLHNNEMARSLPTTLGKLSNLNRAYLHNNGFTGHIPSEVGTLDKMVHFMLDHNRLNGPLPSELGEMGTVTLRKLSIADNAMTGTIPSTLASLSTLEEVDLRNNSFTSTIPRVLPPNLKSLNLGRCGLIGTIPSELGLLTKLTQLWLFKNIELAGSIPTQLGLCTDMLRVEVDFNQLTGRIPTQIGSMTNLDTLSLYLNTYLTGLIPSELGLCTRLAHLFLDRNRFSGPLPEELVNLQALRQVNISNTMLSGTFPANLCDIEMRGFDCGNVCGCDCPCSP